MSSEYSVSGSDMFFLSCFKIIEYAVKVKARLEPLFSEIFIDPINNWDKIKQVFEPFGTEQFVSNASFSTRKYSSDGMKTIWMMHKSQGVLVQCYNTAKKLGILNDSTASLITITINPTSQEQTNLKKWEFLAIQYEEIKQLQISQLLTAYAANIFYRDEYADNYIFRSTAQLLLYNSYLAKINMYLPKVFSPTVDIRFYQVAYDTIFYMFPELMNIYLNDWWDKMLFLDIVNVEYEDLLVYYTVTSTDVAREYLLFPFTPHVAIIIYILVLPDDEPFDVPVILKTCYGFEYGDSKTWDCTTCEYANQCKHALFITPLIHDLEIQNKLRLYGTGLNANDRLVIKYKRVTVL